jgi:hypothetical protein
VLSQELVETGEYGACAHHSFECCLQERLKLVNMELVHITVLCVFSRTCCSYEYGACAHHRYFWSPELVEVMNMELMHITVLCVVSRTG